MRRIFRLVLLLVVFSVVTFAQDHSSMPGMQPGTQTEGGSNAMSTRHLEMGGHMRMTDLRPLKPGDQQRADNVLAGARRVAAEYKDYTTAEADGYRIFLPNVPQKIYHFTNYWYGFEAGFGLNPDHPTSLLYEKTPNGCFKFVGVMYTAPLNVSRDELDSRLPLSIAQWHLHTNFCRAPLGRESEYLGAHAKFGLLGSITTREECEAQGGSFEPTVFGWMVHVYPLEKNPKDIWSVERQMEHTAMQHEH
jgi:hypothetical protein